MCLLMGKFKFREQIPKLTLFSKYCPASVGTGLFSKPIPGPDGIQPGARPGVQTTASRMIMPSYFTLLNIPEA